jgi:hypothetical protein
MRQIRRGFVALGLLMALVPLSAQADGNQDAIDKAKAEKAALVGLPALDQGVMLGQQEIANARAIGQLLRYDAHAQTELPNSMQQYAAFCDGAIQLVQAKVTNASAMVMNKPWDGHAQDELANANAMYHTLWNTIGTTYPGNPFLQVRGPSQVPVLSDDGSMVADDEVMASGDDELVAVTDDAVPAPDDQATVVADAPEVTPE